MARMVLVADDSPSIQKRALGILKGEGFEVETVSNGVAAIKRLAVLRPTVVLADVSMPGRDGYEVCEFVKRSAEHARVPVLLVASDMEPYDDARGAQVRADGIIKKPFEPHDLVEIVVRFAERFEAEAAGPEPDAAPAATREPTQEVPAVNEETAAPLSHQIAPEFASTSSEGVAFVQPTYDEPPPYTEPAPADTALSFLHPGAQQVPSDYARMGSPELDAVLTEPAEGQTQLVEPAADETVTTSVAPSMDAVPVHFAEAPTAPPEPVFEAPASEAYAEPLPQTGVPFFELAPQEVATQPLNNQEAQFEPAYTHTPEEHAFVFDQGKAAEAGHAESAPEPLVAEQPQAEPAATAETVTPSVPQVGEPSYSPPAGTSLFEPVFIEEETAQEHEHAHPHMPEDAATMIFRAPLEIAEPVWSDDSVPVAPAPEPASATAAQESTPEPITQPAAEEPAAPPAAITDPDLFVTATHLDSFSLAEAAAGQVHFASSLDHGGRSEPEPAPVMQQTLEPVPVQPEPAKPLSYVAPLEPEEESPTAKPSGEETAAHEDGAPPAEEAFIEMAKEPSSPEPPQAAVEHFDTSAAAGPPDHLEPVQSSSYAVEPEALPEQHPAPDRAESQQYETPTTQREPDAATAQQPHQAYDWAFLYAVVHRTVSRMSPPVLPAEVVDHLARQIAGEIAAELAAQPTPPSP